MVASVWSLASNAQLKLCVLTGETTGSQGYAVHQAALRGRALQGE